MTRDPIGYEGGINLYGFCAGNPINKIDPYGLQADGQGGSEWDKFVRGLRHLIETSLLYQDPGLDWQYPYGIGGAHASHLRLMQMRSMNPGVTAGSGTSAIWNNGWRGTSGKFTTPQGTAKSGDDAVNAVEAGIKNKPNWKIINKEVTARLPGFSDRRYDLVVQTPSGKVIGIEVKSGTARRTAQQREFDIELGRNGRANPAITAPGGKAPNTKIRRSVLIKRP